jgi:predicted enzyme related to lactoylglutathione lyase
MHGQFVWYELTTPDPDGAQKFYPRFTGWGTQKFDDDYTIWTTSGKPFAGIFRLGPEMRAQGVPPNWMPYVETDNVGKTAELAASLGGKIISGPSDIPGTGRYAVLQDPQGAVFGIYKSNGPSQAWDGTPVVGRFSWHELMTTDWKAAWEFYETLFGWERQGEMDMGGGNMYAMWGKGRMFGGMFDRTPEMASMRPFWLVYIHVKDVGKAMDIATKAGAFVQRPRMDIPGGTIAILGDPQGAGFALHDLTVGGMTGTTAEKAPSRAKAKATPMTSSAKAARKTASAKKASKKQATTKQATKKKVAKKVKKKTTKRTAKRTEARAGKRPAKKSVKRSAKRRR